MFPSVRGGLNAFEQQLLCRPAEIQVRDVLAKLQAHFGEVDEHGALDEGVLVLAQVAKQAAAQLEQLDAFLVGKRPAAGGVPDEFGYYLFAPPRS